MENESRSHGHRRHASSVTLSRKHTSELHGFAPKQPSYDDIFSDPRRFGAPPRFSSRVEDYHEIFNSSRASRGSSIPVLDLPAVRESEAPVRPRSSQLDYSKIFQGFADSNFASTYDQLFPDSNPKELDTSSDDAWTLGETESLSEDSDSFNSFEACHQKFGAKKQFNMSYHRTNQRSRDGINGTTHIAQLHVVPGFTRVVDQNIHLQMTNGSKLVPPKISVATPNMNMSGELLDSKVGRKDEEASQQRANKSNAAPPKINSNINFSGEIVNRKLCKKNEEIAQQRTKESIATPPMISANITTSGEIVSRKVGETDGETAQQRTEESKAAPPKISVATSNMNSSGETANRKVGKKNEETTQQRINESKAAPPKITPDMNTSGEIIDRKFGKKVEESAQQRTKESKAAPTKRSPDMNTSGELVNRTVGKKGEETAQQRTNERKATPQKLSSDTNAGGEIIDQKVGKKDEESAQQRTNESKAAPPKISPGMNTSGEIVNRKAGKNEEETAQQRTNESEAEQKISPDLNTGGKIVNRKVGKNEEETAQQRKNETEAAPKITPDLNAGGEIVNRNIGKKVEETPQQRTDRSKTMHPEISVSATNISISGEMVNRKDVNIAASHILNYRSNRSASEGDLKFQSVTCGSGPYENNTLFNFNAQDSSLKNRKADFNKPNATKMEGSGIDASKDASWSPPLSDEELDVGSDAAASLVAVRRAIEDAQARIRIAKEAMKRKEEGFGSSFKCMLKDNLKSKQKREVEISHDVHVVNEENPSAKCERVDIAKGRSIGSERENKRKMNSVSPSFDDEEFFDAKEAPEEMNDKGSESFPDHCWDGAGGEEAVKQFHKLANSSRQKTLVAQQAGTKNKMDSIEDYKQKENETTEKIFEQPAGTTWKMKAPMEAQEQGETTRPTATKKWEEQTQSSNLACGISENTQVEQNVGIFSNKEEHEENQKVIYKQDNVDKLKISNERLNVNKYEVQGLEENEIESGEWVEMVKNLEIAHEEEIEMGSEGSSEFKKHENEDKKKLKEACEWREECEELQEITCSEECWEVNYSYEREHTDRNSDEVLRQDFDERRPSDVYVGEGSEEIPKDDYVSEKSLKLKEPSKDEDNDKIPEGIYVFEENDERLNEEAPEWVDMYEKWKETCRIEENENTSSSDINEHVNEINTDEEAFEHEETLKADDASRRDEIINQCQNQESCSERDGVQGEEAQEEVGRITEILKDSGELEISEEVNFPNGVNEKEMFERTCLAQVAIKCDDIMNMGRIPEAPLSNGIDIGDINVNFDCKQIFWNNCIHNPSACDLKQHAEALDHEVEDGVEDAKEAEVALNHEVKDLKQHVEALVHEVEDNVEDAKEAEVPLHHKVEDLRQHVEALIHEVGDHLGDFVEAEVALDHKMDDLKQNVHTVVHQLEEDKEAEVAFNHRVKDHEVEDLKQHVRTVVHELEEDKEAEVAFNHRVKDHEVEDLKQHVEAVVPEAEDDVEVAKVAEVPLHHQVEDLRQHVEEVVHEAENGLENAKETEVASSYKGDTNYFKAVDAEGIENGKNIDPTLMFVSENETIENVEDIKNYKNTKSGEMDLNETTVTIEMETQRIRQKEVKLNKQHLMAKDEEKVREREIEREKDRIAVERAIREARERAFVEVRERAERAAVEKATSEARERVKAKAQERIEKASAEAKFVSEKAATEAKLRAERAAVERATAEARERALKKAMSEKASFNAREHAERFSGVTRENGIKQRSSSLDPQSQSSSPSSSSKYSNSLNHGFPHATERFDGARVESAQRCQAKLERHQRTVERAAKALAEKNMRDLLAQKEQAERNRLAESLDAEVKRWSTGKHGKLRALLSTLQYILGSDSGWQPVTLNEILNPDAAKKAYRKAALYVHPDKLQQRGATIQQKYICEKVFDLLQDAWNKFNSEER